jgi:hypothetical protein
MLRVLALEDVVAEEVCKPNLKELGVYRIKTAGGRYAVVLADSEKAAHEWAASQDKPAAKVAAAAA